MRWRVASEVVAGKGHLTCGNLRCKHHHDVPPSGRDDASSAASLPVASTSDKPPKMKRKKLQTLATTFAYSEAGESKVAEVTLILCRKCAEKLAFAKSGKDAEATLSSSKRRREPDVPASASDEPALKRSSGHRPGSGEGGDDRAPTLRTSDGVYIADGFGSYMDLAAGPPPAANTPAEPQPATEARHPSAYVSQVARWRKP